MVAAGCAGASQGLREPREPKFDSGQGQGQLILQMCVQSVMREL